MGILLMVSITPKATSQPLCRAALSDSSLWGTGTLAREPENVCVALLSGVCTHVQLFSGSRALLIQAGTFKGPQLADGGCFQVLPDRTGHT